MKVIERFLARPGVKALLADPFRLFLLLSLWLSLEYWGAGPFSFVEVHDVGDCVLPRAALTARQWWEHGLTYWIPAMTGGVDRLANGSTYASPAGVLFLLLPPWLAFGVVLAIHLFLSTYFTYRLCRDDLGLAHEASLYAGAAAASVRGADVLAHQWGYAAFPLLLWAAKRAADAPGARGWLLMAGLGFAYSAASSMATSLPFCLAAMAAWFLFVEGRRSPLFWLKAGALGLAAVVPQLHVTWAMWLNAPWSHRADWARPAASWAVFRGFLAEAWGWFLAFKLPLVMAAAGGWSARGRVRRLGGVFALFFGVTFGVAVLRLILLAQASRLDFLNGFQFQRFQLLAPFFATVLGAIGVNALPSGGAARRWLLTAAVALIAWRSLAAKGASASAWASEGSFTANFLGGALKHLPVSDQPYRIATLPHGLHPAYANASGVETVDGYNNLYPKTYQRFWERVIEPAGAVRGMGSMVQLLRDWGNRVYLVLDGVPRYPEPVPFDGYYRLNLLSLANMRYVLSLHPLEAPGLVPVRSPPAPPRRRWGQRLLRLKNNFLGRRNAYVYENLGVLPRAFVARRVEPVAGPAALWSALNSASVSVLRETVYARASYAAALKPAGAAAKRADARIMLYSPDRIEVDLDVDGGGVLVVTNNFSPFWRAAVDGRPRALFPAYELFWAVPVARGDRRVVFTYEPPYRLNRP